MSPVRTLIAEDHALMRSGFRMLLDAVPEIEVAGEASDGIEAVAEARRLRPDVVLMDIRMPRLDGIEATRRIVAMDGPPVRVLMLTTFDLEEYVYRALQAGASGFLLKDVPPADLVAGLEVVARGDALLAPSITRRLIQEFALKAPTPRPEPPGLDELTARERQVLTLLARGLSNAEIAGELVVSEATVKTHVANVLTKLGLRDRVQAVVLAYECGIRSPRAGALFVGQGATSTFVFAARRAGSTAARTPATIATSANPISEPAGTANVRPSSLNAEVTANASPRPAPCPSRRRSAP